MTLSASSPWHANEDSSLVLSTGGAEPYTILAVADGVGGLEGGAEASRAALSVLRSRSSDPRDLASIFTAADAAVVNVSKHYERGAASTLSLAVIEGRRALVASLGDSQVSLIRNGSVKHRTDPDVSSTDRGDYLVAYLGSARLPQVAVAEWDLREGDTIVICSDGVWRFIDDEDLVDLSDHAPNLIELMEAAIGRARDAGSTDDATLAVARMRS